MRKNIEKQGLRDDTVPNEQQADSWLFAHRMRIVPQLIAGLDAHEPRIAWGCLRLLTDGPSCELSMNEALPAALLRIAGTPAHPLRTGTVWALRRFAGDPGVHRVLLAALADHTLNFRDEERLALATALGADGIVTLKQLADRLWQLTNGQDLQLACRATLALAAADPHGHALTHDQQVFLLNCGSYGKVTREYERQCAYVLASLDRA